MPPVVPPKQLRIVVTECQSLLDDVSDTPDAAYFHHLQYSLVYVVVVVEREHRGPIVREGIFLHDFDTRSSAQVLANEYPCKRLQPLHERLVLLLLLSELAELDQSRTGLFGQPRVFGCVIMDIVVGGIGQNVFPVVSPTEDEPRRIASTVSKQAFLDCFARSINRSQSSPFLIAGSAIALYTGRSDAYRFLCGFCAIGELGILTVSVKLHPSFLIEVKFEEVLVVGGH